MAGILFFKTRDLEATTGFYRERVGMDVWLEQEDCVVLSHGNLLLGFCQREERELAGTIAFFYPGRSEVDAMYLRLQDRATAAPAEKPKYRIYHFFARDPEQRELEFQTFLHPLAPFVDGRSLLVGRRSIRSFTPERVPDEVLWQVFELCRFAPTARNSQSYDFVAIRDRGRLDWLASLRGASSAPLARAGLAVAITADPARSKRHLQNGCIAAYHLLLAARVFGLGTCWIGAMDRDDVKDALQIPRERFVATITPVGYPAESPETPPRRPKEEMVRFVD